MWWTEPENGSYFLQEQTERTERQEVGVFFSCVAADGLAKFIRVPFLLSQRDKT